MRIIPDAATGPVAASVAAMRPAGPPSILFHNPANRLLPVARSFMLDRMTDVTRILSAIVQGNPHAAEQLLPLVYDELRKLATQKIAREAPGQTLQATALVHEAYLRLVDVDRADRWNSRGHFFAAAAEAMRRILVEQARRKKSAKGGGRLQRVELHDEQLALPSRNLDLIALDEALNKLASHDRRKAELVKLRYFAGLTIRQAAAALGIAESTADADWAYAKSWLRVELADAPHQLP
jgi:RNA polymerase sigma factor (TIGR02999 family)